MTLSTLVLLAFFAHSLNQREPDLKIGLHLEKDHARVGEYIASRISYTNVGSEAFYIQLAKNLGPGTMTLVASLNDCVLRMDFARFTMRVEDLRFLYVPLRVGDRLERRGPHIGSRSRIDIGGLALPYAGTYEVHAVFESHGDRVEGGIWPIWRGIAESDPVEVTIDEPDERELSEKRAFVRECLDDLPACERSFSELDYFSRVYVPDVASDLGQILEQALSQRLVTLSEFAARALANQGREEDSALLFRLEQEYKGDWEYQHVLEDTIETWKWRSTCVVARELER